MLTSIRRRVTYANVAMTLALMFAMAGGAYAAGKHWIITSKSQIKPSVLAQLKGGNGTNGKDGAQGPAGPVGAQGAKGDTGLAGSNGTSGKDGVNGKDGLNGQTGATGPQGPQGTTGAGGKDGASGPAGPTGPQGPLQSGKTETGSWTTMGPVSLAKNGTLSAEEQEARGIPISFALPVESALTPVFLKAGVGKTTECPGTAAKPEAKPGFLCVYTVFLSNLNANTIAFIGAGEFGTEVTSAGAIMRVEATAETGEEARAWGTWAVTAK